MKRRGVSEVVSAVMLLAVMATVSFYALGNSVSNTAEHKLSISNTLEQKGKQNLELLAVITESISQDQITLELINYGTREFLIDAVFVDGIVTSFTVSHSDGIDSNRVLEPRQLMILQVMGSGNTLHVLTNSKNLISLLPQ